jgi:hypothetical protein
VAHLGTVALAAAALEISAVLVAAWGEATWAAVAFLEPVAQLAEAEPMALVA